MNFIAPFLVAVLIKCIYSEASPLPQKIQKSSFLFDENEDNQVGNPEELLIAKITSNFSAESSKATATNTRRHSKREAADRKRFRSTWNNLHARIRINSRRKKPRNPCGFLTRLDLIGYNPNFGCKGRRATQ